MFKELSEDTTIVITKGLILMDGRIYILLLLRKEIYSQNHDPQTVGYLKINYILERI
jgi:hypothetical protein